MKKIVYLLRNFSLIFFLLFSALISVSYGAYFQADNIKQTLTGQLKESSDTEEILKVLQNTNDLTYRSRSRGNGVREFQNLLLICGYSIGKADGVYGSKTAAAVSEFQSANNLSVTGEADLITQFLLVISNNSFTQRGSTYIARLKNYAVIIWPGKAFYVGALDDYGNLSEGTYCYFSNYFGGGYYAEEYKNNKRSGKGTAKFANGDLYKGQWNNDAMNGYGTYNFYGEAGPGQYFSSNEYYEGNMFSNKMHGKGMYYFNGINITGRWSNNHIVK